MSECSCRKHVGMDGPYHVGGWTDPECPVHLGERPPWMTLDDWMEPYEALGITPGPVLEGSPEAVALEKYRKEHA